MLVIANYGIGNLESVKNMLRKAGGEVEIASEPEDILKADIVLIPGVGHFGKAMEIINRSGFREALDDHVLKNKKPILGICLGMQLLLDYSEEGDTAGLGYIKGKVKKLPASNYGLKLPNMGWNEVKIVRENPFIQPDEGEMPRYYFVHSYYAECERQENVLARAEYGISYDCAIHSGDITGVQFHPEKSHRYGLNFFRSFMKHYAR